MNRFSRQSGSSQARPALAVVLSREESRGFLKSPDRPFAPTPRLQRALVRIVETQRLDPSAPKG